MESHSSTTAELENNMGMGGSNNSNGTTTTGSRWNPTKEQISMLENLYEQGIRTPSEEQIKQIASRLSAYGHIEGKNVFYWFQNHKARQRQKQKQKQESIAYFNRYIDVSQPNIFSSPYHCQSVICPQYCMSLQNEFSFYTQHPNLLGPRCMSPRTEKFVPMVMPRICDDQQIYEQLQFQQRIPGYYNFNNNNSNHEATLTLFPLHPTGILESKSNEHVSSLAPISAECSTDTSSPVVGEYALSGNKPFFDFLTSGQGSRESDDK